MQKFLKKIFGDESAKILKNLEKEAEPINALESGLIDLDDIALQAKTADFKKRIADGETLDDIAYEAFAVVREAAKRTLKQRHYDVQLIGGLALHRNKIAEMRTGEGKTLTSTLPIYLNALSGKGVHVVTVNDYLAKRDMVWMGEIFTFLGMTIGCIQQEGGYLYDATFKADAEDDEARDKTGSFIVQMDFLRPAERKEAYDADITYGTNNQFGFDYLRDNMATTTERQVQRELNFAIIDEVDSILIDEARTPLIISAPAEESAELYYKFSGIVKNLKVDDDYNLDEKLRAATFTEEGLTKVEKTLGVENLYAEGLALIHHAEQALKAHALFKIDKDYVVVDGQVKIVDEFTGRILEGRRYSQGLHQAIEAKEAVDIKRESKTLATITFQNYFRMYNKLSGMTGTAETEAEEFYQIYGLDVVVVPTNKTIAREDYTDRIYKTEKGKFLSVVDEVKKIHATGQPILIGTASIEKNELIDTLLTQAGVPHEMLNAKNHEREAQIVAQAGKRGSITVATNMAGRGVDIVLGGNPSSKEDQEEIKSLGGLYVIGTERHESRRIDNQLRGRSGRQGDPGVTRFFVSLEDDLMRIFASDRVKKMMDTFKMDETVPIESKIISRSIEKAQERVEGHHFDTRKHVLQYDDVLNKHREATYVKRDQILLEEDKPIEVVREMVEHEVERVVLFHTTEHADDVDVPKEFADKKKKGDWDPKEIAESLATIIPLSSGLSGQITETFKTVSLDQEVLAGQRTEVIEGMMVEVDKRIEKLVEQAADEGKLEKTLRTMMLRANDNLWVDHLETMRYLRRSIGLRSYGQRDPLVEYKKEAYGIFNQLVQSVEQEIVYNVFKVSEQMIATQAFIANAPSILEKAGIVFSGAQKTMARKAAVALAQSRVQGGGQAQRPAQTIVKNNVAKVGRNEPCSCGSGKKYKKCHGV
ncbi:preprotein translocase subunit SecA [Candidatus Uhrbacteria bacterium]|jgi:preprotein translocase subunit SecA|nr:preprotein translocase subunit SecA [Candidatus Uhrbacteria bacterium]